jgi:carbamate kinase
MVPKVLAACHFARETSRPAVVGALADIDAMVAGSAGTRITTDANGVAFAETTTA